MPNLDKVNIDYKTSRITIAICEVLLYNKFIGSQYPIIYNGGTSYEKQN